MTRRKRNLSGEERTLWATVARTVAPLRPEDAIVEPPEPPAEMPPVAAATAKGMATPAKAGKIGKAVPPPPPPLHPIERRTLTRVARGTIEIDGRNIVIGFVEAHRSHGGGGALYVRIRKKRTAHKAGDV